jgi:hypothetical protein
LAGAFRAAGFFAAGASAPSVVVLVGALAITILQWFRVCNHREANRFPPSMQDGWREGRRSAAAVHLNGGSLNARSLRE